MILWLIMMHHHTKLNRSEILSRQTFNGVPSLHCDLDLEYSNTTFSQYTPAYEHAMSIYVGHNKINSSEHIIKMVISLYERKLSYCDRDLEHSSNPHLHKALWLIMMCHNTGFGYKRFSDSNI